MRIRDRILKSILILGCSIIIVCSIPFPSHAAAIGSIPYDFDTFYPVFRTLLLLGGLTSDDPVRTGEYDPSTLGELDPAEFLSDFLDDAGTFQQGLNLKMIAWCAHAIQYGRFLIPEDEFQIFKSYLVSKFGNSVGATQRIGSLFNVLPSYGPNSVVTVHTAGYDFTGAYHDDYTTLSFPSVPFFVQRSSARDFTVIFNSDDRSAVNYTVQLPPGSGWYPVVSYGIGLYETSGTSGHIYNIQNPFSCSYDMVVFDVSPLGYVPSTYEGAISQEEFYQLLLNWRLTDVLSAPSPVTATILSGVDALSAIGNKVLSSTTSIDSSTGELTGTLSITLPNLSALNDILDSVRAQNLSYAQALELLNIRAASSTATTQELTDILEVVKASTLPISDALTSGYAKQAELATIAGSVADTLTQETIEKIRMGYDPDQESPPYWPMWLNWLPPDLDFDDPTADSSGIIPQVVNVFGVTSGWITGLLEESGAFSYIFYIGILFVLFSVVVGMYHFIGNLNSRPSGNPSVKAKVNGKSVIVPKGKKGS